MHILPVSLLSLFVRMLCFRTTSHGFNTDVNWRCDNQEHVGWFADWFDDSSWSNALVVGNHPTYNSQYLAQNFDINAKLIWFYDTSFTGEVFCRARFNFGRYDIFSKLHGELQFQWTCLCRFRWCKAVQVGGWSAVRSKWLLLLRT